jgi:hypothetical protein
LICCSFWKIIIKSKIILFIKSDFFQVADVDVALVEGKHSDEPAAKRAKMDEDISPAAGGC